MMIKMPISFLVKAGLTTTQALKAKNYFNAKYPNLKFIMTSDGELNALRVIIKDVDNDPGVFEC